MQVTSRDKNQQLTAPAAAAAATVFCHFFWDLNFTFDTVILYYFEAKVLRVLLQLESPKSEHRNSSYVLNNPDYSMFKNRTRIWLEHSPTLSEFLGHIESEFEDTYFLMLGSP